MPVCDTCGNDYDKVLRVTDAGGGSYVFDSIECAAHRLAPQCDHCGCRVLGHGIEADSRIFCCAHCAAESGVTAAADRV
jgi:hypothetical protein